MVDKTKAMSVALMVSFVALASTAAQASDAGTPTKEKLSGAYTGKAYSPYAKRTFPERPLWGDNHLHTSLSMDAGGFRQSCRPAGCLSTCSR